MAKVLLGPMVGQISGSVGATTWSHNRFGYYIRQKVKPVLVSNYFTAKQRSLFQSITSDWQGIGTASQLAWKAWAQNNPVMDTMGNSQILTGHQAYMRLNLISRRNGPTTLTLPPVISAPNPLLAFSVTGSIGAGINTTFSPAILGATECLQVRAALVNSAGISAVNSLYKLIYYAVPMSATPIDITANLVDRWGSLTIGQVLHLSGSVADSATGLCSVPRVASITLVA